jgi:hypothetical protein
LNHFETREGRRSVLVAAALAAGTLLLVWLPFFSRPELLTRHFDGPNFMVVAKTFYVPTEVNPSPGYVATPLFWAWYLPVYPLTIRLLSGFGGYPVAMLLSTALYSVLSAAAFAVYLRRAAPEVLPIAGTLALLLLPSRALLYRSIGANEGAMTLFVLLAVLAFHRERDAESFAWASLSAVTRISGIVVIGVLFLAVLSRRRPKTAFVGASLAFVPLGLLSLWHGRVLGDPLAYFHVHRTAKMTLAPFAYVSELLDRGLWVEADLLALVYLFFALSAVRLWSRGLRVESGLIVAHLAFFSLVRETDQLRYLLSVAPFAVVVAWPEAWRSWRTAAVVLGLLGPLSFLYAWRSIPMNLMDARVYENLLLFLGR